jgi:phosphate-selective porin OprO/OprP
MGGTARAQDVQDFKDLKARLDKLEQQNQDLKQSLDAARRNTTPVAAPTDGTDPDAVKKLVTDILKKEKEEEKAKKAVEDAQKKAEAEEKKAEGVEVGSAMGATAEFRDGLFLWISTPNKDFTMHIGGWYQYDNVFWSQSSGLKTPAGGRPTPSGTIASGAASGGIGLLEDGTFWRRVRPFVEGTYWENGEYRFNIALENDQFSTTGLDEFWMGWNNIPILGTVRVGHVKDPMGLEADMTASSRTMTFMERSSYSEAIEDNENFVSGVWTGNHVMDDRLTWQAAAFRQDNGASSGTFFGDGQYGVQGRITALPLYEADGRCLIHVGLSAGWRNGTNNIATSPSRTFQLRARPELRDDDPAGSPAGAQVIPNANSTRMVDTGVIAASDQVIVGSEFLWIMGPLSLQAEYGLNRVNNAMGFAPSGLKFTPSTTSPQDYVFHGGYVQLAYTLTGENRSYDRKLGTLDRYYFGQKGPYSNAWLVQDAEGNISSGIGAWEIAGRFSHIDLNDGSGANKIQGGVMDGLSLGLNWYLNNNMTIMTDVVYNHRYDLPAGSIPGYTTGLGTRFQLSF